MAKFEVGDIVICVDTSIYVAGGIQPPLRLNAEYIVQEISECKCGAINLDVGLPSQSGIQRCRKCLLLFNTGPKRWCAAERFVKKDQKSIEQKIAEAVDEEDYETAHILQQQLN